MAFATPSSWDEEELSALVGQEAEAQGGAAEPGVAGGDAEVARERQGQAGLDRHAVGKAERLSFDVPTLPLFIHERLSTKAIVETLTGHKRDKLKVAAAQRWVAAVNAEGSHGSWAYAIAKRVADVGAKVTEAARGVS